MIPGSLLVRDRFAAEAQAMRAEFERPYRDPRKADPKRFVWDWWNLPGKYTHLRTPAWEYFSPKIFKRFSDRLVEFGRTQLGCHGITPPWLSLYLDGCEQHLHADVPHGPWAWVFSLSGPGKLPFQGGETQLLDERALSYFEDFPRRLGRGVEKEDLTLSVRPEFNRLVVFDPRLPQSVTRVSGPRDPLQGRLVIHGWFSNPRPFAEGKISNDAFESIVGRVSGVVGELVQNLELHGVMCFRIESSPQSRARVRLIASTLRGVGSDASLDLGPIESGLAAQVREQVKLLLPKGNYKLTIPIQCSPS